MRHVLLLIVLVATGCLNQSSLSQRVPDRMSSLPPDVVKMTPDMDLCPPVLHSAEWEDPVPVPGLLNTAGAEDSPFVFPEGNTLYFFFTPDVRKSPQEQLVDGVTGIYVTKKEGEVWGTAERVILEDPGELALDGCAFIDQNMMWFCSVRHGNLREIDIYTAEFKDGRWTSWKDAGKTLNVEYEIGELHICGDELYFHSPRDGGKGEYDIWVCRRVDGEWQPPENVEAVNTPENEGWPFLTEDGTELWFTRTYQGSPAIFRSKRIDGEWSEPDLIISQFAGEPTLDRAGNIYFVHHFVNENGIVEADIYVAYQKATPGPAVTLFSPSLHKRCITLIFLIRESCCTVFW